MSEARDTGRGLVVSAQHTRAEAERRPRGLVLTRCLQPERQIHWTLVGARSDRVEPAEVDREALARQQRCGLAKRQADGVGVGADDLDDEGTGQPLRRIAAGLAAPFARREI